MRIKYPNLFHFPRNYLVVCGFRYLVAGNLKQIISHCMGIITVSPSVITGLHGIDM